MVAKAGVDPGLAHQILSNATSRRWMLEEKLAMSVLADNLEPGFKLKLMRKDLGLALDFGKALETPMFSTALVHQLYTQAMGLGKGELDCFGISQLYTDATGVSLAKGKARHLPIYSLGPVSDRAPDGQRSAAVWRPAQAFSEY